MLLGLDDKILFSKYEYIYISQKMNHPIYDPQNSPTITFKMFI